MANCSEASGFFPIKLKSSCKMKAVKHYGKWLLAVGSKLRFPRYILLWETGKSGLAIRNLSHELGLEDIREITQVAMNISQYKG